MILISYALALIIRFISYIYKFMIITVNRWYNHLKIIIFNKITKFKVLRRTI